MVRLKNLWPYVTAVALVAIGATVRFALDPIAGDFYAFTVFYAVVPVVAWRYGRRPALIALGLSALVVNFALLEPAYEFGLRAHTLLGTLLFLTIGYGLALLGDGMRRSRAEAEAKAVALGNEVRERQAAESNVKRLNALLTERFETLQAVINASPIPIAVATDVKCEHVWGNEAFTNVLGLSSGGGPLETLPTRGRIPFKFYRGGVEMPLSALPMHYSASHGEKVHNMELELVRDDGRRFTVLGNAAPLHDTTGAVRGAVGVYLDITERRAAEREREEASRRKDEFLATLAHELRNPLAPLRNAAAIIRQRGRDDEKLRRASDVIERQVVHMTRLVDDLLDVARITRGLISLKKESVDLRTLVWQAVELVRPAIEARKQQLRVELPLYSLPLHVDRVRIIQAITNVLSNATKYTPEHGSIFVAASDDGSKVELKIRDSGIGIPQNLLPKVFEVFVQGDRSLARIEGGLGLGLTLVKRIVELHEGDVSASSGGVNRGAEFTIRLPLAEPAAVPNAAPPAHADTGRQRILVVDDNHDVADTLSMLLEMSGHEVRAAYSGEAALDVARAFKPSVAFFDLGLPGMDGYELARRFRADPALQATRLIALTGYGRTADRARSADAGFDMHLTKPFDPEQLDQLLQKLTALERHAAASGAQADDASNSLTGT